MPILHINVMLPVLAILALAGLAAATPVPAAGVESAEAVHASSPKTAGLAVAHRLRPGEGSGGSMRVELSITGVSDPGGASLRYTVSGPGRLLGPSAVTLAPGAPAVLEVDVQRDATESGRLYLNVFTAHGGRTGVVSVPLGGRDLPRKSAGVPKRDASGQGLVVLPAQSPAPAGR